MNKTYEFCLEAIPILKATSIFEKITSTLPNLSIVEFHWNGMNCYISVYGNEETKQQILNFKTKSPWNFKLTGERNNG